jgi:hypothetical protein
MTRNFLSIVLMPNSGINETPCLNGMDSSPYSERVAKVDKSTKTKEPIP